MLMILGAEVRTWVEILDVDRSSNGIQPGSIIYSVIYESYGFYLDLYIRQNQQQRRGKERKETDDTRTRKLGKMDNGE